MTQVRMTEVQAARRAYEAYAWFTGGKTFDGREMPKFESLPEKIQNAWRVASCAVVDFERGLLENGAGGVGTEG